MGVGDGGWLRLAAMDGMAAAGAEGFRAVQVLSTVATKHGMLLSPGGL